MTPGGNGKDSRIPMRSTASLAAVFLAILAMLTFGCGRSYDITSMSRESLEEEAAAAWAAGRYHDAEELYTGLMYRFPGAAHTDLYLYRVSVSQREMGLWADAEFGLRRLVRDFPRSAWADDAQLELARLFWDQRRDYRKDIAPVEDAISELAAFYDRYPGSDLMDEAEELRRSAYDLLARRNLFIGRFYARRERWDAALLYLNEALSRYGGSRWKADILIEMGRANHNQGNDFSARRFYQRARDECDLSPQQQRAVEEGLARAR
jgi:outer membrane protein assembly factor BamD